MKTYNLTNKISAQAKQEAQRIIDTHNKYKGAYWWSSSSNAGSRRYNEKKFESNNPDVKFITKDGEIEVSMTYNESAKNVYYYAYFMLDGKRKNISLIKKLLK